MKKVCSLFLTLTICITFIFSLSLNVKAADMLYTNGNFEEDIEMIRNYYLDDLKESVLDETLGYICLDTGIKEMYKEFPQETVNFICNSLKISCNIMNTQENKISPLSGLYPNYYTNITPVRQDKTYWCGPAAGVQAMIGAGVIPANDSATNYVYAQNAMATLMKTTTSGTDVINVQKGLNSYLQANVSTTRIYSVVWITSEMDIYTLATSYIGESIQYDRPCVVQTQLNRLPYYKGTSTSGHYVTIQSINGSTGQTTIVDPHYDNAYFGKHVVSFSQLKTMLQGKALILYNH